MQSEQFQKLVLRHQTDREHQCHQAFKTSPYEQFKNNNPDRVAGTCRWVLGHEQFRAWQNSTYNDVLWISADPGCGKSVLAKTLIDDKFRKNGHLNVCYFFFKDNESQNKLTTALCAIFHQLFSQQPELLCHAIPAWDKVRDTIQQEADELWRIFLSATADPLAKPVICVLDALDECGDNDRAQLITKVCDFYERPPCPFSKKAVKFLFTSRPYDSVQRWFKQISSQLHQIWLQGEHEHDRIRDEINRVIDEHTRALAKEFSLSDSEQWNLAYNLKQMQHRKYLWLHLTIEDIRAACRDRLFSNRVHFDTLPKSVEDAYERILNKIDTKQEGMARRILSIILGARRPLRIGEMARALGAAHACELDQTKMERIDDKRLKDQIRSLCGLFIFINHSQVFLIHKTAKEFLLASSSTHRPSGPRWQSSFQATEVENEMARLCTTYLILSRGRDKSSRFFKYCAEHWTSHLSNEALAEDDKLLEKALVLYDDSNEEFDCWFSTMCETKNLYPEYADRLKSRSPHVIATNGHTLVLKTLHRRRELDLNARDSTHRTPLYYAAERNDETLVQWLLESGVDECSASEWPKSPLMTALEHDNGSMIRMLLEQIAESRQMWANGALFLAAHMRMENAVRSLLQYGADVNACIGGWCPLSVACSTDRGELQQLLSQHLVRPYISPPQAAQCSRLSIVQLLLENGADVNALDANNRNVLQLASELREEQVVDLLLKWGAKMPEKEAMDALISSKAISKPHRK